MARYLWPKPNFPIDIRSFLGLESYYIRYFEGFASTASPLIKLTKKKVKFKLFDECEISFSELKSKLTTTLVLTLPYGAYGYVIYYDASRFIQGNVFM